MSIDLKFSQILEFGTRRQILAAAEYLRYRNQDAMSALYAAIVPTS